MRISGSYNPYTTNNYTGTASKKPSSVREYSNYLMGKYSCLKPGKNAAVSVTGGLLRRAMSDEKTGEWLERELSKAPDYVKEAQQSAQAKGWTLKSISIEFGEEYTTMTVCTVTDGGEKTDPDIDKWLERIKKKKEEQKEAEKKLEKKKTDEQMLNEATNTMELKGKDLADLTNQFAMKLSMQAGVSALGGFDVKA